IFAAPYDLPDSVSAAAAYVVEGVDRYGVAWSPVGYAGPSVASGAPKPNAPRALDTVWVALPADWQGRKLWLRSVDRAGNRSVRSNAVAWVGGAAASDTAVFSAVGNDLVSGREWKWTRA